MVAATGHDCSLHGVAGQLDGGGVEHRFKVGDLGIRMERENMERWEDGRIDTATQCMADD